MVALLTLLLAALVGRQFPPANHLAYRGGAMTASRLFTADFVGASMRALLPSTLLIPLSSLRSLAAIHFACGVSRAGYSAV